LNNVLLSKSARWWLVALAATACVTATTDSAQVVSGQRKALPRVGEFIGRIHRSSKDELPYRLFVPRKLVAERRYPLILWLHGGGGVGTDNVKQIEGDQVPGTQTWTTPERQAEHPAFVLAPQTAVGWGDLSSPELGPTLTLVVQILDALLSEFPIDPRRVYVLGQSVGGYGVVNLISKKPERFAAAIILCPTPGALTHVPRAATVPVWIFQGDTDLFGRLAGSRALVAALKQAGGHPRYTEYPNLGHDIWTRVFAEPEIVPWLFAQRR